MKKGFTLIELLIIVVIVGLLITIAIPEYKTAMEKSRGFQGVTDVQALSEAVNAYYVLHDNSYGASAEDLQAYVTRIAPVTKNNFFSEPEIIMNSDEAGPYVIARLKRETPSTQLYVLNWKNQGGQTVSRTCAGSGTFGSKICQALAVDK